MDGKKLSERQKKVLSLIEEQGSISTERLCENLSISESTARRLLMTLEEKKYIRRFRGGAMILRSNRPEPPVLRRSQESRAEKEAIAHRALRYIHEGDTILLSAGSTVLELCPLLKGFQHLTVLTDSLLVQNALMYEENIQLILLGGILNSSEQCTYGFFTSDNAAHFRINTFFTGAKAISVRHGLMTDDFQHLPQYRSFRECADRTVAMAHHQKLYQDGVATLLRFQEVDALLIDSGLPQSLAGDLREAGCNLELCEPSYEDSPSPDRAQ